MATQEKTSIPATRAYSPAVLELARANCIPPGDLPLIINGCSGGFSWAYRLVFSRLPSCEDCCDLHDLRYQLGGSSAARKAADIELRECARGAGCFSPGLKGLARMLWRSFRAYAMYLAVRIFGGSKKHWAG